MTNQPLHKLPVGVQNFESLIRDNFLYVDKTAQIWRLVNTGRHYFLARPRRFGKSLLLSTIEAYFQGKKELFEGLYIQHQEKEWQLHPIFHVDLSPENYSSVEVLTARLDWHLSQWENIYGKEDVQRSLSARFENCIMRAVQQTGNRAIILVDEYDKPILSAIGNPDLQNEMRTILKAFYGVLKSQDGNIRFSLLTGVTKFSKVSIFSDLNNLNDISRDRYYYDICGISQFEIDTIMQPYIQAFAEVNGASLESTNERFRSLYDGYRFTASAKENIYNPFSVLTALVKSEYGYYWFETGTPNFIVELLKNNNYILSDLTAKPIDSTSLDSKDDHGQSVVPLLFQSGYLTISHHDAESGLYYMDFPNDEVKSGFFRYILPFYTSLKKEESAFSIGQFVEEIRTGKPQEFMARLQSFFADFQYDAQTTPESHFRNVLFILCKLLGMHVDAEYMTSDGRIDLLIRTNDYIYIIECKLDSTAKIALQQIEDKQYSLPWALDHREQIKIGVNFSSKKRRPDTWLICRGSVVVESKDSTSSQATQKTTQKATQKTTQKTTQKATQKTTQKIIELIENNNKISIDEMAQVCGLTRDGINYHIRKLKEKGLLERIGPDNGGSWVVKKN